MARIGDHPNVVSIHDVIEGPDHLYIVSPYLPGGDLASVLARREGRGLPLPQAVRIASQICRGLEGAHACGIVHRDLSPGNVFLDAEGNAYLGDFGFSRPSKPGGDVEVVGTPAYMAPEQVSGKASEKSDLYSLGCLLYELLSGRAAADSACRPPSRRRREADR